MVACLKIFQHPSRVQLRREGGKKHARALWEPWGLEQQIDFLYLPSTLLADSVPPQARFLTASALTEQGTEKGTQPHVHHASSNLHRSSHVML